MENLNIAATDETPNINLDAHNKLFIFSGKSLPEDVTSFYSPVIYWLDQLKNSKPEDITVEFKMDYFNTASSKIFLDILFKLEEIHSNGGKIIVKWYSKKNDPDMQEAGEEYSDIVEIPFEHISY